MTIDYSKLKRLRRKDLRVGQVVVGGVNVSECWTVKGEIMPLTIIDISGDVMKEGSIAVFNSSNGKDVKNKCECSDCACNAPPETLTKLYLYQEFKKNSMTSLKEKFVLALTKEPQKSFRKAGVTNGDDVLTEEGQQVFLSWLLHKVYTEQFKKEIVDDLLANEEKK